MNHIPFRGLTAFVILRCCPRRTPGRSWQLYTDHEVYQWLFLVLCRTRCCHSSCLGSSSARSSCSGYASGVAATFGCSHRQQVPLFCQCCIGRVGTGASTSSHNKGYQYLQAFRNCSLSCQGQVGKFGKQRRGSDDDAR